MSEPIDAIVLGATGYVAGEALRLIAHHPRFELAGAVARTRNSSANAVLDSGPREIQAPFAVCRCRRTRAPSSITMSLFERPELKKSDSSHSKALVRSSPS